MNVPRLRVVVVLAVLLGCALGGSASAQSLLVGPLVEHWDGSSWMQVAGVPSGPGLTAVVAPSASDVWAFGTSRVAVHWDGSSWHRVPLPIPKESAAPAFWGAAAVSPDDIWAVGSVAPAHAPEHAIIDHWNGSRWQLVSGPPARSELYGVAALSANDVWAVGDASVSTANGFERLALTLHWNGVAWRQVPTPNPAPSTMPASSSATSSPRSPAAPGRTCGRSASTNSGPTASAGRARSCSTGTAAAGSSFRAPLRLLGT